MISVVLKIETYTDGTLLGNPKIEMRSEVITGTKEAYLQFCEDMWNRYHGSTDD